MSFFRGKENSTPKRRSTKLIGRSTNNTANYTLRSSRKLRANSESSSWRVPKNIIATDRLRGSNYSHSTHLAPMLVRDGKFIQLYVSTLRFTATGLLLDARLRKSLPEDLQDLFHLHILDSKQHHCMVQQISHL